MANLNIHASPEFLNQLNWQPLVPDLIRDPRLSILIEMLEGLAISTRDLHWVLSTLSREAQMNR